MKKILSYGFFLVLLLFFAGCSQSVSQNEDVNEDVNEVVNEDVRQSHGLFGSAAEEDVKIQILYLLYENNTKLVFLETTIADAKFRKKIAYNNLQLFQGTLDLLKENDPDNPNILAKEEDIKRDYEKMDQYRTLLSELETEKERLNEINMFLSKYVPLGSPKLITQSEDERRLFDLLGNASSEIILTRAQTLLDVNTERINVLVGIISASEFAISASNSALETAQKELDFLDFLIENNPDHPDVLVKKERVNQARTELIERTKLLSKQEVEKETLLETNVFLVNYIQEREQ